MARCDGCGQDAARFSRRYREEFFCSSCYAQLFRPKICPGCGKLARIYIADRSAVCRFCEASAPCIRCGRSGKPTGRLTRTGPLCSACARAIREPEICAGCGRVARCVCRSDISDKPGYFCSRCARIQHETCQMCSRHRPILIQPDGRRLCRKCAELGTIPCPQCGGNMPAGFGLRCQACYWSVRFSMRLEQQVPTLPDDNARTAYRRFCQWLRNRSGSHVAFIRMARYVEAFRKIRLAGAPIISFTLLIIDTGPATLRRYPLLEEWLTGRENTPEVRRLKITEAEQRRIHLMDNDGRCELAQQVYASYLTVMQARYDAGYITISSLRYAMGAASRLLALAARRGHVLPEQSDLNSYLRTSPGMRAQLSGITIFLNHNFATSLVLPVKRSRAAMQRHRMEKYIRKMRHMMVSGRAPEMRTWLRLGLACFHHMTLNSAKALLSDAVISRTANGYVVRSAGGEYTIPFFRLTTL